MLLALMLFGRDAFLSQIEARLVKGARIVTLWGPGGIGKTSIALALLARQKDNVAFAALAADTSTADVLRTIGSSLDAPITRARSIADGAHRIGEVLAARKDIVLVLDNAETIIDAVADLVVRLRALAPDARFIVTSREPLGVAGEEVLEVPPLEDAFATELLVERARAVRADFEAPDAVIADLVSRTEGIPLAIELCAARLDILSATELAARLDKSLEVLKTPRRDIDERHRTIFASLALSHRLLEPEAQRALAALAVFATDFDLAAAEAVAGSLDVVEELVRKSLVRRRATSPSRILFALQPAVLAFVRERLGGPDAEAEARHAKHFAERVRALRIDGSDGKNAIAELARLEPELVAVVDRGDAESATEALLALSALAIVRGPIPVFVDRARRYLQEKTLSPTQRGRVETALGASLLSLGQLDEARALLDHAVTTLEGRDLARALHRRGEIAHERADYARAKEDYTSAIANAGDDRALLGLCLSSIGVAAHVQGALDEAREHYVRARALLHEADHLRGEARTSSRQGFLATDEGNTDAARRAFAESFALCDTLGDERLAAYATAYVGNTWRADGDLETAIECYDRAIAVMRRTGDRLYEAVFVMDRAIAFVLADDAASALEDLDVANAIVKDAGDRHLAGLIAGYRVIALAMRGAHEEAIALARTAKNEAFGTGKICLEIHEHTARVLARSDHAAEARVYLELHASDAPRVEHVRLARRMLARAIEGVLPPDNALVIERSGARVPGGVFVELQGRSALHAVFTALVERRLAKPGAASSIDELLAAGWPGERVQKDAAAIRVRVTIAQLRKLGLAPVLGRTTGGYRLDPAVPIVDRRRV